MPAKNKAFLMCFATIQAIQVCPKGDSLGFCLEKVKNFISQGVRDTDPELRHFW